MENLGGLLSLAIAVLIGVGMYKTFAKMGYDDAWWAFIPILNILFMLKVAEKPLWYLVAIIIPLVNVVVFLWIGWLVASKVANAYGKSTGYAIGLMFLGFIFYPILGFGAEQPTVVA